MIGIAITFFILAHFINHCYGPLQGQACRL